MHCLSQLLRIPVAVLLLLTQVVSAQQVSPGFVNSGPSARPLPGGYDGGAPVIPPPAPGEPGILLPPGAVNHFAVPEMAPPPNDTSDVVTTPPPLPSVSEQRRWSFNFQSAPWMIVLRTFAKEAGFSLHLTTEADGEFTYFDENFYSATEVLDVFNDHLMTSGRILIRDGNRLTLTQATAQIPGNLIPFVPIQHIDLLGRNELASVAIPLRNTDTSLAVEEIQQLQSPLGQVKALTNSGRVIVTDTGSYLRRMRDLLLGSGVAADDGEVYVYPLKHAQADEVAKAITDFLSQNGSAGGTGANDGSSFSTGSAPAGQRVVAEKTTNSLLVRGTSAEMETIRRIIDELDRAPREVLVQALLVEVELGNIHELGVELGFQDSVLFDRSVVDKLVTISQTTTSPNGTQTTNQSIISQTAAPGFNFNNQPLGGNVAAHPGRVGPQGLSNFGVGRVNGDLGFGGLVLSAGSESVNVLLRALDAHFNIDVLSRPQVRAVENHEAFIQIGQQVPVVDGVAITPVGSANPVIRQDQAGIILKVTPRISPDGRVQLDVNAEKSAFNLAPGTGVPIFTDATNGNVIEAPIKDITTADTTVSIQSGQTIVLGGMITNDQTVVTRKVPWLGDIPVLGWLFRYDLNRHKRKELLVFLTPTVLENGQQAECVKDHEVSLMHMPAEAFSFGDQLSGYYPGGGTGPMPPGHVRPQELPGQEHAVQPAAFQDTAQDTATAAPRIQLVSHSTSAMGGHSNITPSSQPARTMTAATAPGRYAPMGPAVSGTSSEVPNAPDAAAKPAATPVSLWNRTRRLGSVFSRNKPAPQPPSAVPAGVDSETRPPRTSAGPGTLRYQRPSIAR